MFKLTVLQRSATGSALDELASVTFRRRISVLNRYRGIPVVIIALATVRAVANRPRVRDRTGH